MPYQGADLQGTDRIVNTHYGEKVRGEPGDQIAAAMFSARVVEGECLTFGVSSKSMVRARPCGVSDGDNSGVRIRIGPVGR